jgi:hypothetical protein
MSESPQQFEFEDNQAASLEQVRVRPNDQMTHASMTEHLARRQKEEGAK